MNVDEAFKHLGLFSGASPAAIRSAYISRAFKAHPDHKGGDTEAMVTLSEARRVADDYAYAENCPSCTRGRVVIMVGWRSSYTDCTKCDGSGKKHGPRPGSGV